MVMRRRPRVVDDGQQLIYGVVSMEEEGARSRPLVGARVSVVAAGEHLVSTRTRRDGSYSVMISSRQRGQEELSLHVTKAQPCVRLNVTRVVTLDRSLRGERLLWQQDVVLQGTDLRSTCEVTSLAKERESQATSQQGAHGHTHAQDRYKELGDRDWLPQACTVGAVCGLFWGFFMLWAIARWASRGDLRPSRHRRVEEHYDREHHQAPVVDLVDYASAILSSRNESRHKKRNHRGSTISVGRPAHAGRQIHTMKPTDERDSTERRVFKYRRQVVRVIVDDDTDDE